MKKYSCPNCSYQSDLWSVKRHILRIHNGDNSGNINEESARNNIIAPTTMYVGDNDPPTTINAHSNTVPIEDYNNVVGIAHEWKKECEIKDNGIHARNEFLTANNHKLQVEHMRNKMLDVENERLQEENKKLNLEKESLVEDGNNKVSAMGQDMAKVIRENKQLKIEKKNEVQTPSNSNLSATTGCGYAKWGKTNKFKAPTTLKIGSSGRIAPSSFYQLNDGTTYYRGENELIDVGIRDICQRSKGIGGMLRAR